MSDSHSDVTETARGLIEPIAADMFEDLDGEWSDADATRIGEAFVEVFKAGMRVGAAEIIASATEQAREHGVSLDLHFYLHDRADGEKHA